jgi:hypothetical protein
MIVQIDIPEFLLDALQKRFDQGEMILPQNATRSEIIEHAITVYLGEKLPTGNFSGSLS